MADDEDADLLNMLLDDETSWSPTLIKPETTRHPKRRARKHSRPMLQCVVCGDHAEGKKISFQLIVFHYRYERQNFRIQLRCDFLWILQSFFSPQCSPTAGKDDEEQVKSSIHPEGTHLRFAQGKLKCRGTGNCPVTVETRKRCKKCRLEKCFRMGKIMTPASRPIRLTEKDSPISVFSLLGMRKDWILSEDE